MELFKAELLKLKKMSVFQCAVVAPMPAIAVAIPVYNIMIAKRPEMTPWSGLLEISALTFVGMLLPILIIYVTMMMGRIENQNNGWKQLLTMPVKRERIYLTKYLIVLIVVLVAILSYLVEYVITAYALGAKGMIPLELVTNEVLVFITLLPFIGLLFFISTRSNSIAVPIGIGMFFILSSTIIGQSNYWIYAPWVYPVTISQGVCSTFAEIIPLVLVSVSVFAAIGIFDVVNFIKKDIL
jgi:hypothetical protein